MIKDAPDPRQTIFIEQQTDIAKVYAALPQRDHLHHGRADRMSARQTDRAELGDVDLGARRILWQRK